MRPLVVCLQTQGEMRTFTWRPMPVATREIELEGIFIQVHFDETKFVQGLCSGGDRVTIKPHHLVNKKNALWKDLWRHLNNAESIVNEDKIGN